MYYANHKKSRTFDCRFWQFDLIENLITTWDQERNFQGASFEPNRIFLALFVWEILKDKVKKCKFGFRKKIHFHVFFTYCEKNIFVRTCITSKRIELEGPGCSRFKAYRLIQNLRNRDLLGQFVWKFYAQEPNFYALSFSDC